MSDLKSIEARIKMATGGDDEELLIIRQLVDALDLSTTEAGNIRLFASAGAYLSAAVALVEAKLPGWEWQLLHEWNDAGTAMINRAHINDAASGGVYVSGYAPTPALALLCAFVAAMGEKT